MDRIRLHRISGDRVAGVVRSAVLLLLPLTILAILPSTTGDALAAGYSTGLSSPTPPTPTATFVWTVSGSMPGPGQEIAGVSLSGCWNAGQIQTVRATAGAVSIKKTGAISIDNLSDKRLPLTVTVTFVAVFQSRTSGTTLAYQAGKTTTSLAVGGPNCQPPVDVSLTKTAASTVASGANLTYTLAYANTGPVAAENVLVTDPLPAGESFFSAPGGSFDPTGDKVTWNLGTLPAGARGNLTLIAAVSATSGTLTNSATISTTSGELNRANNNATATSNVVLQSDLSISDSDGTTTAIPGTTITYAIVVRNSGPSAVNGASVADSLPGQISSASWTCSASSGGACGASSGIGGINTNVSLPAAGTATFSLKATIDPAAIGSLANSASVSAPSGATDPDPSNNSTTDTDTLSPQADLAVTNTDGTTTLVPGTTTTYTVVVTNNGPSTVAGAQVDDTLPSAITSASWTCTPSSSGDSCGAASGSGNISTAVTLGPGDSATFSLTAAVSPSATGNLSNTANVTAPAGVTDANQANNTAPDTDTLKPQADISITKTSGASSVQAGSSATYQIVVSNQGPSTAPNVPVTDSLPSAITSASWTCATTGSGDSCGAASGSGNINTTVTLDPGDAATFSLTASIDSTFAGQLSNTASVAVPPGIDDPTSDDNSSTATIMVTSPNDFAISAAPNRITLAQGDGGASTISTALTSGSAGTVGLSASVSPAGPTAGLSPTSVTAGGSATLSIAVDASVAPGSYTVTVTGTEGSATHSTSVAVTVVSSSDFSISAAPNRITLAQGDSGASTISTALTNGSAQTVDLTASGLPAGATASFEPTSVTAGQSSTLSINTGTAAAGSYSVTVTGTGTSAIHSTTLTLTIQGSGGSGAIVNGGFETGSLSGWTASGASESVAGSGCHGGSFCALLGSTAPTNGDSAISQAFTAPSGTTGLSLWYSETCPDTVTYDWATATLTDNTAGTTAAILPKTCTTNAWTQITASVAAGHSYTLTLTNHDDNYAADPTYTLFDDVSLTSGAPPPAGITNGGFEAGSLSGWTASGASYTVVSSGCHGGSFCALLGSTTPTNGDSSISQAFTAPSGTTVLSLWYRETCPDTVTYDWATVTLKDNATGTTATILQKTCAINAWTPLTASVVAGHSYTLTLTNHDDNYAADPTYTLFDDVSLH